MAGPFSIANPMKDGIQSSARSLVVAPFVITHDMPDDVRVTGVAGGDGLSKVVGIRSSASNHIRHGAGIFPAQEKGKDNGHLEASSLAHHPVHRGPRGSQG